MSRFRISGEMAQGLIANRLYYTQAMEISSLIREEAGDSITESYLEAEAEYVDLEIKRTYEMIRICIMQQLVTESDDVMAYYLDGDNRAFPLEDEGVLPDTIDEYLWEIANDLVTLFSTPAPDVIAEIEDFMQDIIDYHGEPFDKN
jgi:hypothetical protein